MNTLVIFGVCASVPFFLFYFVFVCVCLKCVGRCYSACTPLPQTAMAAMLLLLLVATGRTLLLLLLLPPLCWTPPWSGLSPELPSGWPSSPTCKCDHSVQDEGQTSLDHPDFTLGVCLCEFSGQVSPQNRTCLLSVPHAHLQHQDRLPRVRAPLATRYTLLPQQWPPLGVPQQVLHQFQAACTASLTGNPAPAAPASALPTAAQPLSAPGIPDAGRGAVRTQ